MLTDTDIAAIRACFVTRGKSKGKLLKQSPPLETDAYAAWQAMVFAWNPYKASIIGLMLLSSKQREVYTRVRIWADENPQLRGLDRDRLALETLGAW